MNIIKIVGASTLKRYTEGILEKGFINNLWVVDDNNPDLILYQIHGAPSAAIDDKDIISKLKLDLSQDDKHIVILLHRPDEIQDRHPELSAILKNAKNKFGLVFFGGFHLNDNFYDSNKAIKTIIPHGFFDLEPIEIKDQIIIGTHTT